MARSWTVLRVHDQHCSIGRVMCRSGRDLQDGIDLANELHADG